MTIRTFGALLCGAVLVLATQTDLAQAQSAERAIKGSKSNGSERMGGGGGGKGAAGIAVSDPGAPSDKTKKTGKGGGVKGNPPAAINLNSSRSN